MGLQGEIREMKIKPAIRGPKNYVDYADLNDGNTFIYHSQLWMKAVNIDDDYEQMAINLTTGDWLSDMCSEQVLLVDAMITWTKQKE